MELSKKQQEIISNIFMYDFLFTLGGKKSTLNAPSLFFINLEK